MYTIASDIRYNIPFSQVCNELISGDKFYNISSTIMKELKNKNVFKLDSNGVSENYIKIHIPSGSKLMKEWIKIYYQKTVHCKKV